MSLNTVRKATLAALMMVCTVFPFGFARADAAGVDPSRGEAASLPRLVDLGSDSCYPCKKMAPILEALRQEYAGQFGVVFIDVWKERDTAKPYRIRVIPTQVFYDESGKELFRHEGFYSGEEILRKWKSFGYYFRPVKTAR